MREELREVVADEMVLWFNLSRDTRVISQFKGRVTQEAVRKFIQLLEASLDTFPTRDATQRDEIGDDTVHDRRDLPVLRDAPGEGGQAA